MEADMETSGHEQTSYVHAGHKITFPERRSKALIGTPPAMSDDQSDKVKAARQVLYEAGLDLRRAVTGAEHVDRSTRNVSDFSRPMQELATELGWGAIWTRPGLSRQQRSLLNLAMLTALGKGHELGVHVRGAVRNGCSLLEIRETMLHASAYAGLPAGLAAFRVAEGVLSEMREKEGFKAKL
ncbi:hypothetical protein LTR29_001490 [Friedmanniomyces endolithicus]|nr:hypothetical protein LTR29_001490 [Friedmanniomyces endolithicus]